MLTLDVKCGQNEDSVTVTTDDLISSLDEGDGIRVVPVRLGAAVPTDPAAAARPRR